VPPTEPATTSRRADSLQLQRQWALLRLLAHATEPRTVKSLAEQLGASKATIARDLATLERDFAIVEEAQGKQKRTYRIVAEYRELEALRFGPTELMAVHAAVATADALLGTPVYADLRAVATKLRGLLSARHNGGLDAMVSVFVPHARGVVEAQASADLVDDLTDAIARRRECSLTYHSGWTGKTRTHRARPLRLLRHHGALYVLACLGQHERITTLAVHRIRALEVSKVTFAAPRVDLEAHMLRSFGIFASADEHDVEIHFAADVAWLVEERVFHPHEAKRRRPDGVLVYTLRSSAKAEILPWVQSWGARATLVAPAAWQAELATTLRAAAAQYDARAGGGRDSDADADSGNRETT
jgi:predicted DNA-binding transcriptional regulator YafY